METNMNKTNTANMSNEKHVEAIKVILKDLGVVGGPVLQYLARHPTEMFTRKVLQRIIGKIAGEKFTPQEVNKVLLILYNLDYVNRDQHGSFGKMWYWYSDKSPVKSARTTKVDVSKMQKRMNEDFAELAKYL